MKFIRKLLCGALAAALIATCLVSAMAVSVDTSDAQLYVNANVQRFGISIYNLSSTDKITGIKSSKPGVVQLRNLLRETSRDTSLLSSGSNSASDSATLYVRAVKKGTSTVSFKVNGTTYKKKFKVLDYVNPISKLYLTGISDSNLKSKFAKGSSASMKVKGSTRAGYLKVTAASGWRVTWVRWLAEGAELMNNTLELSYSGVSSAKLLTNKLKKGSDYECRVKLRNTKTNAVQTIRLTINY